MGKSRRNRSGTAGRRADPIAGPPKAAKAVKAPSDPALAALRTAKILPVVSDLRSADPKTRAAAAGAIANIVDDARCRKLLLREQVVHVVLTETLADDAIESRAAGWSVLNVLAQHEEPDFCVHLYRCDVLTPAALALRQIRETLALAAAAAAAAGSPADAPSSAGAGAAKLTSAQKDFMWRITSSILDLVGQLADARDEILAAVAAQADITRALFALAAGTTTTTSVAVPFEIQWAALTTLTRLCEDDKQRALAEVLVDDQHNGGCYAGLRQLQAAGGPLAVAASSVLHAVFTTLEWFDHSPGRDGVSDASLVPTLAAAIEAQLAQDAAAKDTKAGEAGEDSEDRDRSTEVLGLALQTLAMIGTTLKASLEKANKDDAVWNGITDGDGVAADDDMVDDSETAPTNGKAGGKAGKKAGKKAGVSNGDDMEVDMEDAGEEDDDEEEEDNDEDDADFDLDQDMEKVTRFDDDNEDEDMSSGLEDLPTLRALIDAAIPQIVRLVAARSEDADDDSVALLLDALSALNNIAWTVSLVDLKDEGNAAILQAWDPVARRVWLRVVRPLLARDLADLHVADQVAGLAWALARVMRGETPARAGEPARFMALRGLAGAASDTNSDDPFQSLAVKCIGVLGQMAQEPASADVNRAVGQYLLGIAAGLPDSKAPAADVVEALNQLFDMYGDETLACDKEVFVKDGLLAAFEAVAPKVKALAKTVDKRTMSELRTRADEAVLNLSRFVQYKKKHSAGVE